MSVLSKILLQEYSLCYNCYEVGHTWTPSCSTAALQLGWCVFSEAVKMYTALYSLNQVVSKRRDTKATLQSVRSVLQSSFFLGFNAYAVIFIFCISRRVMGKFYYVLAAHIPATIGSFLAIQLERPARRPALSFYVANVAGETLFNKLVHKGWFPVIPRGEVALFAVSIAALLTITHANGGFGKDPVSMGLRFLLGAEQFTESAVTDKQRTGKEKTEGGETACSLGPSHRNRWTDGAMTSAVYCDKGKGGVRERLSHGDGRAMDDGRHEGTEEQVHQQLIEERDGGEYRRGAKGEEDCVVRSDGAAISGQIRRHVRRGNDGDVHSEERTINFACPHSLTPRGRRSPASATAPLVKSSSSPLGLLEQTLPGVGQVTRSATGDEASSGLFASLKSALLTASLLGPQHSCSAYVVHAFVRNFLISVTGHSIASLLLMRPQSLLTQPMSLITDCFAGKSAVRSLKVALFVASFASLFKGSSCLMRAVARRVLQSRGQGEDCSGNSCALRSASDKILVRSERIITFVAGLIAGSSMILAPSSTAAQYVMWKVIETMYFDAVRAGKVKYVDFTMDMLYAVSTAQLFYVAVMEPKMMRRSYTKWLNRVTRNSFSLLNRNIIDIFGTESSFGYVPLPDLNLDVNYCTDKFKESVLVWMI